VDRRKESRLLTNTPVTVTMLNLPGEQSARGYVVDMSGSGLRLRLPAPIPGGTLVKVRANDVLMLGEVVHSAPLGAAYSIGVQLSHSLAALGDLERLNRTLLGTESEAHRESRDPLRIKR
jgi:PilZ domain